MRRLRPLIWRAHGLVAAQLEEFQGAFDDHARRAIVPFFEHLRHVPDLPHAVARILARHHKYVLSRLAPS